MNSTLLAKEHTAMEKYLGIEELILQQNNQFGYVNLVQEGLKSKSINAFIKQTELTQKQVSKLIHLSERTLQRNTAEKKLDSSTSERLVSLSRVYFLGTQVFGDQQKFNRWIKRSNRGLNNTPPLELMETNMGLELVKEELNRIESGVFS